MCNQERLIQLENLGLGLLRIGEVFLAEHTPKRAEAFQLEKTALWNALRIDSLLLVHGGSTAIPGIVAKPILDIVGGVDSLQEIDAKVAVLERLGYKCKGEYGIPGRRYCVLDSADGSKTYVHLHLFEKTHYEFYKHLVFTHYLKTSPQAASEYELLKKSLANNKALERKDYSNAKHELIQKLQKEAESLWPLGTDLQLIGGKDAGVVKKVLIYVLRTKDQREVLVFDHVLYPEVSPQLPSGTVEENEDVLVAAKRELFEESGIQATQPLKFVGNYLFYKGHTQKFNDRTIFTLSGEDLPETWTHTVTGKGADQNLEFRYYWLPVEIAKDKLQANLGDGFKLFKF